MSPLSCGLVATLTVLCGTVVSGLLLGPQNVQLTSYNMDLRLIWDPPENLTSDVLYSTKIMLSSNEFQWKPACVNTSALYCNLTDPGLRLNIMEFGKYTGSVQAVSGHELSEWVNSLPLSMDRDTVIGPPTVLLVSHGPELEVNVKNPEFRVSTIDHVYSVREYNISHWPIGNTHMAKHKVVQQSRVVLNDLKPWTEYCVQVQVIVGPVETHHPTIPSEPVCEKTTDKPSVPWIPAVLVFFAVTLTVVLVASAIISHKRIGNIFCPVDTPPEHLLKPTHSHLHSPPHEVYDQVTLILDQCTEKLPPEDEHSHCTQTHSAADLS